MKMNVARDQTAGEEDAKLLSSNYESGTLREKIKVEIILQPRKPPHRHSASFPPVENMGTIATSAFESNAGGTGGVVPTTFRMVKHGRDVMCR